MLWNMVRDKNIKLVLNHSVPEATTYRAGLQGGGQAAQDPNMGSIAGLFFFFSADLFPAAQTTIRRCLPGPTGSMG